eukprot:CAMPEP_0195320858 /NCGR_PEP_ID=MMETSP0708-20121125/6338_1 /TAXON_ID=33640 /ORGANISM="Asterionellopsis glacialis, Strain CCMP134" /LENGTH=30 /DNA_ID= /DNA_START= /DNA_END= /DNA_ORIENTATION=
MYEMYGITEILGSLTIRILFLSMAIDSSIP